MKFRDFDREIAFTNDGSLSLFFLGTGNAFSKELLNTNLLIVKGNDHVLVDCGLLTPLAFKKYNTGLDKIKNLIITHAHADHVGGLEELALSGMYIFNSKPNIIIEDCFKKSLWNNTLKGGLYLRGEEGARQRLNFNDYFNQIKPSKIKKTPRPMMEAKIGSLDIKLFRTKHEFISTNTWKTGMYSTGLLIDERIVFTGDTKFDPELLEWLTSEYKIEHIFHDTSFYRSAVHAHYEDLKTLPEEIKKITTLCHYDDKSSAFDPLKDGFAGMAKSGLYYDF